MSSFLDTRQPANGTPDRIGPGRLVLVIGPSGAGKDTLIAGTRVACAGDPSVVFPRRAITRPSTLDEAHDTISENMFRREVEAGKFALWWEANGHCYGLPISIEADIRNRKTVVCNVSRTIVGLARQRYAFVTAVLVTAPREVLMERLERRSRSSDGAIEDRIGRSETIGRDIEADDVILNVGLPRIGIRRLLDVIRGGGILPTS